MKDTMQKHDRIDRMREDRKRVLEQRQREDEMYIALEADAVDELQKKKRTSFVHF